jgi:8-oxoguanine deaminase
MTATPALPSRRLWIKHPLAALADDAANGVVVEGTRIVELVPVGRQPRQEVNDVFDASEYVVLPGLINAHHHFFQTLTRAHPDGLNKPLFDWLAGLYPTWSRLTLEAIQVASRLAYTELLMSGCSTTVDHHYLYPAGVGSAVDVQVQEARDVGIRAHVTRGSMSDTDGGVTPRELIEDDDDILADCERVLARYHDPRRGSMLQIGLAPCSPFNATERLMTETAELATRYGCTLHTHCGESLDEVAYCEARFGCRPIEYLERTGWIGPRTWLAHGIHFSDEEVRRLGQASVGVAHCPTANMVLGSGQCRTLELERAGSPVGLGVDGSASNDNSNLMESVRHALMLNRLTYGASEVSHTDVLRWATQGSARCIGREDIGSIEVGREADLALFKLDELRFSGSHDPVAALVLCGAHQVERLMIAGEWKVIDGRPLHVDIERLRHEHGRVAAQLSAAR